MATIADVARAAGVSASRLVRAERLHSMSHYVDDAVAVIERRQPNLWASSVTRPVLRWVAR